MKPDPKRIRKLSFLIHPGFFLDSGTLDDFLDYYTEWDEDERSNHSDHTELSYYTKLMEGYAEKAKQLKPDEVLVILARDGAENMHALLQNDAAYPASVPLDTRLFRQLKTDLGKRCVVLTMDSWLRDQTEEERKQGEFFNDPEKYIRRLRTILHARGYDFDVDTVTEAFGESMQYCVTTCADLINRVGEFEKRTDIDVEHTDVDDPTLPQRQDLPYLRKKNRDLRVRYVEKRKRR